MVDYSRFKDVNVLVVGDLMLDRTLTASVDRISAEAPVPIARALSESYAAGGAGNTAMNVSTLSAKCTVAGVYGNDASGLKLWELFKESGLNVVAPDRYSPTIVKLRTVCSRTHQQLPRIDWDTQIPSEVSHALAERLSPEVLKPFDVIVVSDYAKGTVSWKLMQRLVESGRPVFVDPKPANAKWYNNVFLVKPNGGEARQLTGLDGAAAAKKLSEEWGSRILLTRSDQPAVLYADGVLTELQVLSHEVSDVTGAGDTVIATLAVAYAAGVPLVDAARLAMRAASIKVTKRGTVPVSLDELIESAG